MTNGKITKLLSVYLVIAIVVIGFVKNVYAGFAPSDVVNLTGVDRSEDLQKIQSALELKMVSKRLEQLGFTTGEITVKMANLSNQELHNVALQSDGLRVGGEAITIIFAAVFAAVVIWIMLIGTGTIEFY
jgi:hypothetical protein